MEEANGAKLKHFYGIKDVYQGFDIRPLNDRAEVLKTMENLQGKLKTLQQIGKKKDVLQKTYITKLEYIKYLEEVHRPLYHAHISFRQVTLRKIEGSGNTTIREEHLINSILTEEIWKP
ncbi:hypothetical protein DITRI_Ditri20bG0014000 [Diplodiscus trichospermus]